MPGLMAKYSVLVAFFRGLKTCAIAFSGGVDSAFLSYVAHEVLGKNALAITVQTPYTPSRERKDAKRFSDWLGIQHKILALPLPKEIITNPFDRCYLCKKKLYTEIIQFTKKLGFDKVVDGNNLDDESDYRPGLRALSELGIRSPLAEARLTKGEIRELSRQKGLPHWDKPAFACLLSRIPHNRKVTEAELKRIEQAEDYLIKSGFKQVRLRSHGDLARIEVPPEDRFRLFDETVMDTVSGKIRALGYRYVCLDMDGYRTGRMNPLVSCVDSTIK